MSRYLLFGVYYLSILRQTIGLVIISFYYCNNLNGNIGVPLLSHFIYHKITTEY